MFALDFAGNMLLSLIGLLFIQGGIKTVRAAFVLQYKDGIYYTEENYSLFGMMFVMAGAICLILAYSTIFHLSAMLFV
ncbi:hypothetical protein QUF58_01885 [Anaerolineales bacterium HSG24]|nr:hypothetical protein [Anaerolineales bacterium HSG24]